MRAKLSRRYSVNVGDMRASSLTVFVRRRDLYFVGFCWHGCRKEFGGGLPGLLQADLVRPADNFGNRLAILFESNGENGFPIRRQIDPETRQRVIGSQQ
ncbi:hypothetical protein CQ14_38715 [Bradyrhizobium lablabi]|uniref:Uncharacterized protein n=1 Tax=Bradyrhizobium lablabi TaxID=722472 RepID=A0A0R3M8V8_9BRAD|nr:hypothetical protein CQ14_38715 [Bradyrhizobium lablabi]